jgi:hypothetical protein
VVHGARRARRAGSGLAVALVVAAVAAAVPAAAKPAPTTTSTTPTSVKSSGSNGGGVIFSAAGGGVGGRARRLGVRQSATGVTLRAYLTTFPVASGPVTGPMGTVPASCLPDRQLLVEYSTPNVAGVTSFASRHDQPVTPEGQIVGLAENEPTAVVVALVPQSSQRAEMQFTGGHTDSATPLPGGWVLLASSVKSLPMVRHPVPLLTDVASLGQLSVIDRSGHRHSLGTVTSTSAASAFTACFTRGSPGPTVPETAPPPSLPQATGSPPADQAGAQKAIEAAYHRLFETSAYSTDAADLEGAPALSDAGRKQLQQGYGDITGKLKVRVNDFRFLSPTEAALSFDLLLNGQPITATTVGRAVLVNGKWKVARATFCDIVGRGGIQCIP